MASKRAGETLIARETIPRHYFLQSSSFRVVLEYPRAREQPAASTYLLQCSAWNSVPTGGFIGNLNNSLSKGTVSHLEFA